MSIPRTQTRQKLWLSAAELIKLWGVDADTVNSWADDTAVRRKQDTNYSGPMMYHRDDVVTKLDALAWIIFKP